MVRCEVLTKQNSVTYNVYGYANEHDKVIKSELLLFVMADSFSDNKSLWEFARSYLRDIECCQITKITRIEVTEMVVSFP
jgi:hypothetical protein